ncbi:MAG: hypothetical protein GXO07_05300 [Crenarchaeota archaeon]|nr:hypothetical protein [Thermoproteota archaeon]
MEDLAKASALVNSITFNYLSLHSLILLYMFLAFVGAYIVFRNNQYIMMAVIAMEIVIWAVALYNVVVKLWSYPGFVAEGVAAVLNVTSAR